MRHVLIVQGGWDGHEPKQCADFFGAILTARGFKVEISATLDAFNDGDYLRRQSLIIPMWTMGTLNGDQETNLTGAVHSGTGLAGFHGGMGDAFRGSTPYQWMVGGQFVAHPDNFKDYVVNIVRPNDDITHGIADFKVHSEQYYMLVDPHNEVLATTIHHSTSAPWVNGAVMPVVWKKMHGAGRVFYSSLGHVRSEFDAIPALLELTVRGMEWAAR